MTSVTREAPKVLLVEDDRGVSRMLRFSLRDAGFAVNLAESGGAALEVLGKEPISAVVLDLGLPDGRGGEVLAWLREKQRHDPEWPRWVVITAQDRGEATRRYGPLGDHFLPKPFDPWDLVRLLQTLLPKG